MASPPDGQELVTRVDSLVVELREELDQRLRAVKTTVEADELFVLAGLIDGALRSALECVESVREALDRRARGG